MSVHPLPTPTPPELVVFEDNYAAHATERTPIVIDNGIWHLQNNNTGQTLTAY